MNLIKPSLFCLALVSSSAFAEDCTMPEVPTLPDGATAGEQEMLAGQTAVRAYQADNTAYRVCLDEKMEPAEQAALGDESDPALANAVATLNNQYNASVAAEEEVAVKFNAELRAYKAANAK
ncbi:MAG: hypothetical protein GY764_09055 [Halieaceae bacterium]|nr:hypothetical protein [Halieaceae bacterium]MCP4466490.1 hypothetical protein [Halieaceae bacterium]MCP4841099.1 hypothetical protein [Halieaceae bacterium]MDG2410271.1 hypothetical protein [Halioglobus sp.]